MGMPDAARPEHEGHDAASATPDRDDGPDPDVALLAGPRRGIRVGRVEGQRAGRLRRSGRTS